MPLRRLPRVLVTAFFAVSLFSVRIATVRAQIDPQTALLEREGWAALASGNARVAADAFRQALTADPKRARLHLGAAMAAALDRRDDDAMASCERALALDPSLVEGRALLGQLLYRRHDLTGAIRVYESLVADHPDDEVKRSVQPTLDRWQRELELHDRMQQAIGSHFTVSFEGPAEADLAERSLAVLDRAYWRVGQILSTYPSEPIAVVLYTSEQFRDITRSPSWAAGAYDGTIRVPVRGALDKPEELERVLSHEFTHALIRTLATSGVPTWLNEGLAVALETGDAPDQKPSGNEPTVPLRLLSGGFGRLNARDAQLAYDASARGARRLLDEAGGMAVANLLRDLGEGVDFERAFAHRIQQSFADFDAAGR
ncbi:MAG TPA: tetratricopeptide repeat protein [Vicinamibacterales bacterium]|jgi:tetratricopeptide (TPR) repeat protein